MFESNYSYYSRSYSSIPSVPKSQFVHVLKDTHFVWEYFWDMCARILVTRASNIFSWKMWGEGGRGGYIRINIVFKFEDKLMCLNIWGNYRKCPLMHLLVQPLQGSKCNKERTISKANYIYLNSLQNVLSNIWKYRPRTLQKNAHIECTLVSN